MLPYKMILRIIAPFLILVITVFPGQTLSCHPTEYQLGSGCCPLCPAGKRVLKDCTEYRSTSCKPCLNETFMSQPTGLKTCFPCAKCEAGFGLKIKRSCTDTSDTSCEPLEGFYCIDSTEAGCVAAKKHRRCQPGQYIHQEGTALRDTECSDCSEGTFSNGTLFICQPHTQCESMNLHLIKPGSSSADAECGEQSSEKLIVISVVFLVVVIIGTIIAAVFVRSYRRKKNQNRYPDPENRKDKSELNDGEILLMNSADKPRAGQDTEPKVCSAQMASLKPAAVHQIGKHLEVFLPS